jgi:hypothetical protein
MLLALDIADKMGVSWYDGNMIYTDVIQFDKKKTDTYLSANYQLQYITQFPLDTIILIEDFVYFNATHRRGMNEVIKRFGYIEYSLRTLGYTVQLVHVNETRKNYCINKPKQKRIQVTNKKGITKNKLDGIKPKDWIHRNICQYSQLSLTNDHTDAILMVMNYLNLSYEDITNRIQLA